MQDSENVALTGGALFDSVRPGKRICRKGAASAVPGSIPGDARVGERRSAARPANSYGFGNDAAILLGDGRTGRQCAPELWAGMMGAGAPVLVPTRLHSSGGRKPSLSGDPSLRGVAGVRFNAKPRTATGHCPGAASPDAGRTMPTMR